MEHLFIDYANLDLNKNAKGLEIILESAKRYNDRNAGPQDPYRQNINFFTTEIFKQTISIFEALQPHINSSYIRTFVNSEIMSCNGAFEKEFIPFGSTIPVRPVPSDRDIRLIALEGAFFWAIHDDGCRGCSHNQGYERDSFLEETKISCIVCDQMLIKNILERIIDDEDLDCLSSLQEAIFKTMRSGIIPYQNELQSSSWIDPNLIGYRYRHYEQQFSLFVLGRVGDNLQYFLGEEPKNRKKIKKCWNCDSFFISNRADTQDTCPSCKEKGIKKQRPAEYYRKYRERVREREENNKTRAYMKKTGSTWKEAKDAVRQGLD